MIDVIGMLFSNLGFICVGIGDQSLLEEAVFAFFVILFLVAVTLNLLGSKSRLRPIPVTSSNSRRPAPLPRRDRSWKSVWDRCVWEFDVLKTYLEETANKYLGSGAGAEPVRLTQRAESPSEADRRRWTRHPSNLHAVGWLSKQTNQQSWLARVRDISEGGIGIVAPFRPTLGAIVELKLVSPQLVEQSPIMAEVMFVTPHSAKEWVLGCEFLAPLTPEQQSIYL